MTTPTPTTPPTPITPTDPAAPDAAVTPPETLPPTTGDPASPGILAGALHAIASQSASVPPIPAAPIAATPAPAGEPAAPPAATPLDRAAVLRYVHELPAAERASWLESLPDVQATLTSARQAVASDLVGNVLGMDLALIPAQALDEAMQGRPERLREALIGSSPHIQSAIRTAHEAGTRASRSQLRGAFPLPPAGDSTRPAQGQAETYEEARSTFSQAAAALLGSG